MGQRNSALGNGSTVEGSDLPVAVDISGVLAGVTLTQEHLGGPRMKVGNCRTN